jgi:hypothetical protein
MLNGGPLGERSDALPDGVGERRIQPDERDSQFIQHSPFNIHNFLFRLLMNR